MPSPFPGMDPYLEHPRVFPDLHDTLVIYLRSEIQRSLPPGYIAHLGRRTWIEASERVIEPDVLIREAPPSNVSTAVATAASGIVATTPVVVTVLNDEFVEPYIEIRLEPDKKNRLVAELEVLSPSNKRLGDRGQALYWQKQVELLEREVNLVEIDLLRGGRHTTAVPEHTLREVAPDYHYHACVRNFTRPSEFTLYPFSLADSFPNIAIPLLPADPAVVISLASAFARAYEDARFDQTIDYEAAPPPPALSDAELAWIRQTLKQRMSTRKTT